MFFRGQPRLWKEKFDVCALSSEKENLMLFADEEGIKWQYVPMKREISLWVDIICFFHFIWIFVKERPYVVHGNTPKASLLSMVAAWLTGRPIRIYMCHGLRYQGTQGYIRKLLMIMEKISCMCATNVFCVSKGVADVIVAEGLCKKSKIQVVGYGSAGGIDLAKFSPDTVISSVRSELYIPEDAFVFVFVGRIVKDKGVNELVSAFEKLCQNNTNTHLILVGPLETKQNPIDVSTLNLIESNSNIHAVGMQKDVRPYLKASNAFVLPSYREGFGMVLIEAGAMGLPCISTNITGCNEIIVSGENGTLVEPKNSDALYFEMNYWLKHQDFVCRMSSNARRMVKERFECHQVWQRYYDEYVRLSGLT